MNHIHVTGKRNGWKKYFLPAIFSKHSQHLSGKKLIEVCFKFFKASLAETPKFIRYTLKHKVDEIGFWPEQDYRGQNATKRKLRQSELKHVAMFIANVKTVDSHYARQNTSQVYTDEFTSVAEMYRKYVEVPRPSDVRELSETSFRQILKLRFPKLRIKKPVKDRCGTCLRFRSLHSSQKNTKRKAFFQQHLFSVKKSRLLYEFDKKYAKESFGEYVTFSFDFQKKLQSPCSKSIPFGERLSTSNLTIVDEVSRVAYCWCYESYNGKQGGIESGTILFNFLLKTVPQLYPKAKHIRLWSDNGSHFKNIFVINAILWAIKKLGELRKLPNLQTISHRFLISGHTQFSPDAVKTLELHFA